LAVVGAAIFGGVLGSFFHKGLGMSKDDIAKFDSELDGGKAALALLVKSDEADAVTKKLADLSGEPETHTVTAEAVDHAEAAAAEAAPAKS
jgi:uncharacterized membrane protein